MIDNLETELRKPDLTLSQRVDNLERVLTPALMALADILEVLTHMNNGELPDMPEVLDLDEGLDITSFIAQSFMYGAGTAVKYQDKAGLHMMYEYLRELAGTASIN